MNRYFSSVFASLAARVIAVVLLLQLMLLFLIATYQQYEREKFYQTVGSYEFTLSDARDLFDYLNRKPFGGDQLIGSQSRQKKLELWEDILKKNPSFSYLRRLHGRTYTYGTLHENAFIFERQFQSEGMPTDGCRLLFYTSVNIYSSYRQCQDGEVSYAIFSNLEPDYNPINQSYVSTKQLPLINRAILWSYGVILILTPFLIIYFIRPLKVAAKAAQNISPHARGYQIPTKGLYSEVNGFVDAINGALVRLDIGYQRENEFRNAIAHELKTPLTALRARIDEIEDAERKPRLINDIRKMNRLIDRVLEFAKASSEPMQTSIVDLAANVQEACAHCGAAALSGGIEIDYNPEFDEIFVVANNTAVFLAVTNILNNAIQHSQTSEPISVMVSKSGVVEIQDKGCGFITEKDTKIFDDFSSRPIKNHGLGISIAMQVIELSGGEIKYSSDLGIGTTFTIRFPTA